MNTFASPAQGLIHIVVSAAVLFPAHMRTTTELALVIKGLGAAGTNKRCAKV